MGSPGHLVGKIILKWYQTLTPHERKIILSSTETHGRVLAWKSMKSFCHFSLFVGFWVFFILARSKIWDHVYLRKHYWTSGCWLDIEEAILQYPQNPLWEMCCTVLAQGLNQQTTLYGHIRCNSLGTCSNFLKPEAEGKVGVFPLLLASSSLVLVTPSTGRGDILVSPLSSHHHWCVAHSPPSKAVVTHSLVVLQGLCWARELWSGLPVSASQLNDLTLTNEISCPPSPPQCVLRGVFKTRNTQPEKPWLYCTAPSSSLLDSVGLQQWWILTFTGNPRQSKQECLCILI